jgi:selenocysteine-specific elongation factor
VREIQSFGAKRGEGGAGERLALALHGVKLEDLERGDMLITPGRFVASRVMDVRVTLAAQDGIDLANRERVRVHHGAREVFGRVILLEADALRAGESAFAQLRLESPVVADHGDRLVIRTYSPARVIGGAVVLEPRAEPHRRFDEAAIERLRVREAGDPDEVLLRAIERAGAAGLEESAADAAVLARLVAGADVVVIVGRAWYRPALDALAQRAMEIALAHTARNPLQWGIDKEELRQRLAFPHGVGTFNRVIETLGATHALFARENRVRAGTPELDLPPALAKAVGELRERVRSAGVTFPSRDELAAAWRGTDRFADALQILRDRGDVVEVGDGLAHPEAIARALAALRELFASREEISVGDFKDAMGITRKHAIPLLEYFDARQVTVRRGNNRALGKDHGNAKKSPD